jgi:hypothetical protein
MWQPALQDVGSTGGMFSYTVPIMAIIAIFKDSNRVCLAMELSKAIDCWILTRLTHIDS